MENAAEALKMAAFVLIFVITLATAIVSFSNVRVTAQTILDYTDREYNYTYVDDQNGQTERIVSAETMVPAIMRAYKENYKIFFYENEAKTPMTIYEKTLSNSTKESINYIDLQKETLENDAQRQRFVEYILYGTKQSGYENEFTNISLPDGPLYDIINRNTNGFREELGEYYQEDLSENPTESENTTTDNVPTSNKTKKRVISYYKQ